MEPTLLVGDELLATKFPYGYSSASLPLSIAWPRTERILGALPQRGDVVVFRYPVNRSQVWVKRVIGLPGDRVQMRAGRLWINGEMAALKRDGSALTDEGSDRGALHRDVAGRTHARDPQADGLSASLTTRRKSSCRRTTSSSWATIATIHADSRIATAQGGVGLLPVADLIGRAEGIVASWDVKTKEQPIWTWPFGLRGARFFTAVH